jgi:hypothetical protein
MAMAAWSKRRNSGAGPALQGFEFSDNLSMRHTSNCKLRRVYRLISALTTPPENADWVEDCHDGLDKSG